MNAGEVTCILGDNGAGKSTFIKILSGVHHAPTRAGCSSTARPVQFHSPRDARAVGIATVYQDLAMVPLMSIWRNFFLGAEPLKKARAAPLDRRRKREADRPRGAARDGDRHPRPGPARRHALGRRAAVGRDRAGRPLRRARADPRRADLGARRQAGRRRPQATSSRRASAASPSSSSPTTRTTPTRSATAS